MAPVAVIVALGGLFCVVGYSQFSGRREATSQQAASRCESVAAGTGQVVSAAAPSSLPLGVQVSCQKSVALPA